MKQGFLHLTAVLRRREILPNGFCELLPVVNCDLKGNCQNRIHICKVVGEFQVVWLFFQEVLDLEMMRKLSNAYQVQLTKLLALSFDSNDWSSQLTNPSNFLSTTKRMSAFQYE